MRDRATISFLSRNSDSAGLSVNEKNGMRTVFLVFGATVYGYYGSDHILFLCSHFRCSFSHISIVFEKSKKSSFL